ncbi:MAG: hypothetical protein R3B60_01115 [Candidatus Paceibacterota bacterium]
MKEIKILYTSLFLVVGLLLPQAGFAYGVVDQTAQTISQNTVLYTITYKFGFLNRETYLPIAAVRSTLEQDSGLYGVSYDILDNGEYFGLGNTTSLVLSKAEIKDNLYYLPEGKSGEFTLVTLLYLPDGVNVTDLTMKINQQPLILVKDGEKRPILIEENELIGFETSTPS